MTKKEIKKKHQKETKQLCWSDVNVCFYINEAE